MLRMEKMQYTSFLKLLLFLNDSVTMVPVRFVSEKLGMSVKWDETSTTVFINSDSSYSNITNLPVYYKASFEDKLTNIINYNFNGDFYQAQAIIGLVTDSEIESARIINPIGLAEFYTQKKETTERNIQLMANGLPNEIEQQLADTRAYLDNAINLYNQGLYYEAADALSDFICTELLRRWLTNITNLFQILRNKLIICLTVL